MRRCAGTRVFMYQLRLGVSLLQDFGSNTQDEEKKRGQAEEYGDCGSHDVTS